MKKVVVTVAAAIMDIVLVLLKYYGVVAQSN